MIMTKKAKKVISYLFLGKLTKQRGWAFCTVSLGSGKISCSLKPRALQVEFLLILKIQKITENTKKNTPKNPTKPVFLEGFGLDSLPPRLRRPEEPLQWFPHAL